MILPLLFQAPATTYYGGPPHICMHAWTAIDIGGNAGGGPFCAEKVEGLPHIV